MKYFSLWKQLQLQVSQRKYTAASYANHLPCCPSVTHIKQCQSSVMREIHGQKWTSLKNLVCLIRTKITLATHSGLALFSTPRLLDWEQSSHRCSLEVELLLQQIPCEELQPFVKNQSPQKPFLTGSEIQQKLLDQVDLKPFLDHASHFPISHAETLGEAQCGSMCRERVFHKPAKT